MSTELLTFEKAVKDQYKKCKNKSCENCAYTCKEDKHWYCDDWEPEEKDNNLVLDLFCSICTKNCTYR